jgi:hypothetical protein
VKERHEGELMKKANVVGVGIGVPIRDGRPAGSPGIIVNVTHKVPIRELAEEDLVPRDLENVRVWVEAIGQPQALSNDLLLTAAASMDAPTDETEEETEDNHGRSNARECS